MSNTASRPRVSMIVPCYNYGMYVEECINSILNQTFKSIEIIAINDASLDGTSEILDRFRGNERIRIIHHKRNMGHIRSYNEGLTLARGTYLGILSADDFCLSDDVVEKQVSLFESSADVGMVYAAHALVSAGRTDVIHPWPETCVRKGSEELKNLVWGNYVPHSGTLIRADVQSELGPYDSDLPHTADWYLWLRVALGYSVGYLADAGYAYRIHGGNMRHKQISATRAADESIEVLRRTLDFAERLDIPLEVNEHVLDHAMLQNAWFDLAYGHRARTWHAAVHAAHTRPRILLRNELWKLLARSLLQR